MGGAIARGLVASGTFAAADITVAGPHQNVLDKVAASAPGIVTMTDNGAAIKGADVIILAVKPWVLPGVLEEIAPQHSVSRTVYSIACCRHIACRP